jgi:hypothetical protein
MIDQFMEVANLKSCKKGVKTALIDLQHLTVLNPRKKSGPFGKVSRKLE